MSVLAPFLRLVRLGDNQVVASTSSVLAYSWPSGLDKAPTLVVAVPLADAGDAAAGAGDDSFATAALSCLGGPGLPTAPVPCALEFSLGGPDGPVDMRTSGFTAERKVHSGELVLEITGQDPYGDLYSTALAGGGRTTYSDIALGDVLGGRPGTLRPIDADLRNRLISAGGPAGTIPALGGLLYHDDATGEGLPGLAAWALAARQRLAYTAVSAAAIASTPVWLDSLEDSVSRAVGKVADRAGGIVVPADETAGVPQGSRGHWVADPSDGALNLAAHLG